MISNDIIPWIEKYRPTKFKDILLNDIDKRKIDYDINAGEMNHLIITGQSGIGKTSTALCIAREILKESFKEAFFELNSSDEIGVKTLGESLKNFCQRKISYEGHKIILLDEADNITPKAQRQVQVIMEHYGDKAKIIFTCNNVSKIIDGVKSKCDVMLFKKLSEENMKSYILKIASIEKIEIDDSGIDAIIYCSNNDMRQVINNLQSTFYAYKNVTRKTVYKICDIPKPEFIEKIIKLCIDKDFKNANIKIVELKNKGYLYSDIINGFFNVVKKTEMDEELRMKFIGIVSQTQIAISNGHESVLQLQSMICQMIKVSK